MTIIFTEFAGDPVLKVKKQSFRVNGLDLWQEERKSYHLGCRIYATVKGMRGFPRVEMFVGKIRDIQAI